jgi:hypothetical protein
VEGHYRVQCCFDLSLHSFTSADDEAGSQDSVNHWDNLTRQRSDGSATSHSRSNRKDSIGIHLQYICEDCTTLVYPNFGGGKLERPLLEITKAPVNLPQRAGRAQEPLVP